MATVEERKRKESISIRLNPRLMEHITKKSDLLRMTRTAYIEHILMSLMIEEETKKSDVR